MYLAVVSMIRFRKRNLGEELELIQIQVYLGIYIFIYFYYLRGIILKHLN